MVLIFILNYRYTPGEMIVCHCRGVSERRIRKAVQSGARSLKRVARECGAGAECGGCRSHVASIVEHEVARADLAAATVTAEVGAVAAR
jgi:bacterioferritin-associated ferredoxin